MTGESERLGMVSGESPGLGRSPHETPDRSLALVTISPTGVGRRMIDKALARAAVYPWETFPVVVTIEHGSKDGKRPWWWGVRTVPVKDDERAIIEAVLDGWRRDAPHPISLAAERSCLRYSGVEIVWFIEERSQG